MAARESLEAYWEPHLQVRGHALSAVPVALTASYADVHAPKRALSRTRQRSRWSDPVPPAKPAFSFFSIHTSFANNHTFRAKVSHRAPPDRLSCTGYISLLSAYLSHATSLDDNTTKCLCPGTVNHCDESLDCCTASCFLCSNDSVNASAFPVDAGGGVKPCPRECCVPDRS